MERVAKYVNEKFKYAGNSREVQNQKEELIASLHDKIHDMMAQGKSEDEAFADAVFSMGSLEELTEALDGRRRTVYVNRLNFHHGLLVFAAIALEILAFGAYSLPKYWPILSNAQTASYIIQQVSAMFIGLGIAVFSVAIWPLVCGILYRSNPVKAEQVVFDFKKRITVALVGWLAISLGLALVNFAFPAYTDLEANNVLDRLLAVVTDPAQDMPIKMIYWFIFPMIGVSNWPISILIYNLLFKNKRYLAKK